MVVVVKRRRQVVFLGFVEIVKMKVQRSCIDEEGFLVEVVGEFFFRGVGLMIFLFEKLFGRSLEDLENFVNNQFIVISFKLRYCDEIVLDYLWKENFEYNVKDRYIWRYEFII